MNIKDEQLKKVEKQRIKELIEYTSKNLLKLKNNIKENPTMDKDIYYKICKELETTENLLKQFGIDVNKIE